MLFSVSFVWLLTGVNILNAGDYRGVTHGDIGISRSAHYVKYQGSGVRSAIWTFSIGGGSYFFHADAGQETVRTGIMGYDPHVPGGDKGMDKRDWLGHASRFFNEHVSHLDSMVPHNDLSSTGTM